MDDRSVRDKSESARFNNLYVAHHRAVLAYCARRSTIWDAWDAASEVFVIAWRRREEIPPDDQARSWLLGVAYRVLSNQRRAQGRRLRLRERAIRDLSWTPVPDEQLIRAEDDREVLEALSRLSRTDREVIQLTLWDELSPLEIGRVLGISRDAVDQRYSRAKRRLARELERPATRKRATPSESTEGGVT